MFVEFKVAIPFWILLKVLLKSLNIISLKTFLCTLFFLFITFIFISGCLFILEQLANFKRFLSFFSLLSLELTILISKIFNFYLLVIIYLNKSLLLFLNLQICLNKLLLCRLHLVLNMVFGCLLFCYGIYIFKKLLLLLSLKLLNIGIFFCKLLFHLADVLIKFSFNNLLLLKHPLLL